MECLPQPVDGAVDHATVEAKQESADRGDAADQDDEARVFRAARGGGAGSERDAVHAGNLVLEVNSPHIAGFLAKVGTLIGRGLTHCTMEFRSRSGKSNQRPCTESRHCFR
jgi:hypothetical protein